MKKTLIAMGLGAGVMYLLDPVHGEERRAQLRDKFADFLPRTRNAVSAKADAITAKAQDLTAQVDDIAAEAITKAGPQTEDGAVESLVIGEGTNENHNGG